MLFNNHLKLSFERRLAGDNPSSGRRIRDLGPDPEHGVDMLADIDIRAPAQLLRVASFKLQKSVESLISSGDEVSAQRDRFQGLSWKTFFLSIKHFIANSSLQH